MVSISKVTLVLYVLIMVLLGLQMKGTESEVLPSKVKDGLLPSKVNIEMTNHLTMKYLVVHCKDKHHDLGSQLLNVGETYNFSVRPNLFKDVTLYFCLFVWYGAVRYFDIYRQDRDHCFGSRCYWEIFEIGPCKINPRSTECFIWNP